MSKNLVIQQSGEPQTLETISIVNTKKYGGSSVDWVEEDSVDTDKKQITQNGTYKASDDNLYGYDKVIVKVPKKGKKKTGKKPQSSGDPNDYSVTADDEGNLVYKKLPTSINIITPPSKLSYNDGELIKKDGMIVKAYYADGGLWGNVPNGEITLDPDRASKSSAIDERDCEVVVSGKTVKFVERKSPSFYGPNDPSIIEIRNQIIQSNYIATSDGSGYGWATSNVDGYTSDEPLIKVALINDKILVSNESTDFIGWATTLGTGSGSRAYTYTHNDKTVRWGYSAMYGGTIVYVIPQNTIDVLTEQMLGEIAWSMWYGDIKHVAWENEITAKWDRPGDNKTLTDKFKISIAESISYESSSNTEGNNTGGGGSSW